MLKKCEPLRFREPSNKEKELIASYIWRTEIKNMRVSVITSFVVCLTVIIWTLLNFWMNAATLSVKDNIVFAAVLIAASWYAVSIQKIRYTKKKLWRRIQHGEYEVTDCKSYCINFPHLFFRKEVMIKDSNHLSLLLCCNNFCKVIPKMQETDDISSAKT